MEPIKIISENCLDVLSRRHNSYYHSDSIYKKHLASLVLEKVQNEKWCYLSDWMEKNATLENIGEFNSSKTKQLTAMMRFTMGSIIKLWLSTYLKNINITTTNFLSNNTHTCGPFSMGMNAPGIEFELFCEKNIKIDAYEEKCKKGSVSLVLGAGNQNFLTVIDIFQRVFIYNECVLVKLHPLREFLFDPYYEILKPLIEENIVHIIKDFGVDFTKQIILDPLINHIHFTGSESTYKAIHETLSKENKTCQVTAELGCVTPWIIFPGEFSSKELKNIAKQLINAKKTNGGSNCITPQLLILPETWSQINTFLEYVKNEAKTQLTVPCYYPNSILIKQEFQSIYKDLSYIISSNNSLQEPNEDDELLIINYGLISNKKTNPICLKKEAFGQVLVLASIKNEDINNYTESVICTLNSDQIYGSLSCSLFFPQDMPKELIDKCISNINYGTIAINVWSLFGYTAATLGGTWGGYYKNAQSGRGRIGNLLEHPEVTKTIIKNNSLENMQVDFSTLPPTFLLDLLFALTIKTSNSIDMVFEFFNFLTNYILKILISPFIIKTGH